MALLIVEVYCHIPRKISLYMLGSPEGLEECVNTKVFMWDHTFTLLGGLGGTIMFDHTNLSREVSNLGYNF